MKNAEDFADMLLNRFFEDIQTRVDGNYDYDRFNYGGVDRSHLPYTHLHREAFKEILRQTSPLFESYNLLEDDDSKGLFVDLLRYRMAGHKHVKLPTNCANYWDKYKKSREIGYQASIFDLVNSIAMRIWDFEVEWMDRILKVTSSGPEWPFFYPQYFFNRNGVSIQPEKGEHVIDAGSCLGDTALAFGAAVGAEGCVYLFDLIEKHNEIAAHNIAQNPCLSSFRQFSLGLSDEVFTPEMRPKDENENKDKDKDKGGVVVDRFEPGFELPSDNQSFPTTTLDHLVKTGEVPQVDFIKMDIEGAEMKALRGAVETLQHFRPKLALSLYHKISDFHEIPRFLQSLDLGYRFYLDHYTIHAGETVLYAKVS